MATDLTSRPGAALPAQREAPALLSGLRSLEPLGWEPCQQRCLMRTPEAQETLDQRYSAGKPSEAVKINSPTAKSAAVPIPTAATIRSTSPRLTCLYT